MTANRGMEKDNAQEERVEISASGDHARDYLMFPTNDQGLSSKERMASMTRILDSLPASFHGALEKLMKIQKMTIEQLEEKSNISVRTIYRLRAEDKREYSLDQVIALCVALHLPPWLSCELLARAGFTLRAYPLHRIYRFVLDCMFMDTVEDVQEYLKTIGAPQLALQSPA